jgi:hypothetical protein
VVSPLGPAKPAQRFLDTVAVIDRLAGRVAELGEEYGFEDKDKAYRLHVIGTWDTPEFEQQPSQSRTLDVTKWVLGPGVYTVRFKYLQGLLGLTASSVALVSHPKDKPDDRREDAVDKHTCHAGAWNKDETYTLDLKQHDPQRTYLVVAQIRGGKTTKGEIFFRKKRP